MSVTTSNLKTILGAGLIGLAVSATGALAYGDKKINDIQARESAAIEQGRYSGELTRREYRDLKAEQRAIQDMENRAKADGHISKREYRNIHEAQANAARHIAQETHDSQKSWYRRWLYNHR
jgi:uncharacterized membrane protein YebE (DUF533 family)